MLDRIKELLLTETTFAFETTLATKSYAQFITEAKSKDYEVVLLFLALDTVELAIQRVKTRVREGGHNIPEDVIIRRFQSGLIFFSNLYADS